MSNRSESIEYNLLYEEDDMMEFDPWTDLEEVQYFLDSLKENPTQAAAVAQALIVKRTRVTFTTDWEPLTPTVNETAAAGTPNEGEAETVAQEPLFEIRDVKGEVPPIKNLLPVRGREAAEKHAAHLNRSYYWGKTRFEIFEVEDIGQPVQPANRVPK